MTVNPFEEANSLRLEQSVLSPNLFHVASTSTPERESGKSLWNIDQRAVLFPADIPTDENSLLAQYIYDELHNSQMNAAVEAFWSQNQIIIESPMSSRSKFGKFVENDRNSSSSRSAQNNQALGADLKNHTHKNIPTILNDNAKRDRTCQTFLSFSPDIKLTLHKKNFKELESPNGEKLSSVSSSNGYSDILCEIDDDNVDQNSKKNNEDVFFEDDHISTPLSFPSSLKLFKRSNNSDWSKAKTETKQQDKVRRSLLQENNNKKRFESPNLSPIRADSASSIEKAFSQNVLDKMTRNNADSFLDHSFQSESQASLTHSEILVNKELEEINAVRKKKDKDISCKRVVEALLKNSQGDFININSDVTLNLKDGKTKTVSIETASNPNDLKLENLGDNKRLLQVTLNHTQSNSINETKYDSQDTGYQTNSGSGYEPNVSCANCSVKSESFNLPQMKLLNRSNPQNQQRRSLKCELERSLKHVSSTNTICKNSSKTTTAKSCSNTSLDFKGDFKDKPIRSTSKTKSKKSISNERTSLDRKKCSSLAKASKNKAKSKSIVDNESQKLNEKASNVNHSSKNSRNTILEDSDSSIEDSNLLSKISASEYALNVLEKAKNDLLLSQKYLK